MAKKKPAQTDEIDPAAAALLEPLLDEEAEISLKRSELHALIAAAGFAAEALQRWSQGGHVGPELLQEYGLAEPLRFSGPFAEALVRLEIVKVEPAEDEPTE